MPCWWSHPSPLRELPLRLSLSTWRAEHALIRNSSRREKWVSNFSSSNFSSPEFVNQAIRPQPDCERWHQRDRVGTYGSMLIAEVAA